MSDLNTDARNGANNQFGNLRFDFQQTLTNLQKQLENVGITTEKAISQALVQAVDAYSNAMHFSNLENRRQISRDAEYELKQKIESLKKEFKEREELAAKASAQEKVEREKEAKAIEANLLLAEQSYKKIQRDSQLAEASVNRVDAARNGDYRSFANLTVAGQDKQKAVQDRKDKVDQQIQELEKKRIEERERIDKLNEGATDRDKELNELAYRAKMRQIDKDEEAIVNEERRAQDKDDKDEAREDKAAKQEEEWRKFRETSWKDHLKEMTSITIDMKAVAEAADNIVSSAEDLVNNYQMTVSTRLMGSGKDWESTSELISTNLGLTGIVSTKKVLENLASLVEHGIAYNVEQRAFLATLSESIATTFDEFDSSLLRIIKLQASDSTVARMGMEAALTNILNDWYGDTSYMSSLSDQVSANLFEAYSQMTKEEAVNFEYIVQKWLGALSSSGVSDQTITNISQAIGYLGSGDINSLTSNTSMQNLLVESLANSNAKYTYSDLLTEGIDSSKINVLMESMVEYLAKIAEQTEGNNLVRKAYSDVYGVTVSDLQAITNVVDKISEITDSVYNYSEFESITGNRIETTSDRMSITKRMSNLVENVKLSTGLDLVQSKLIYPVYKIIDLAQDLGVDMSIPTISVLGNSLSFEGMTVMGLLKSAIVAGQSVASLIESFSSGNLFGSIKLESFNGTTSWGGGTLSLYTESGKSSSETIQNLNTDDLTEQTIEDASNGTATKTSKKLVDQENEENGEKTSTDIYYALTDGSYTNMLGYTNERLNSIEEYVKLIRENYVETVDPELILIRENLYGQTSDKLDLVNSFLSLEKENYTTVTNPYLNTLSNDLKALIDHVLSLTTDNESSKVLSVNIKQLGSQPVTFEHGLPIRMKTFDSESMGTIISEFARKLGLGKDDVNAEETVYTLQDVVDMLMAAQSDDKSSINVNLNSVSSSVNATTFLSNEKYYEDRL